MLNLHNCFPMLAYIGCQVRNFVRFSQMFVWVTCISIVCSASTYADLVFVSFQGVATYSAVAIAGSLEPNATPALASILPFASGASYTGIWSYDSTNGVGTLQHNVGGTSFRSTNASTSVLNNAGFDRLSVLSTVRDGLPTGWSSELTGTGAGTNFYRLQLLQNPISFLDGFSNTNIPTSFSLSDFTSYNSGFAHEALGTNNSVRLTTPQGSVTVDSYSINFSISQMSVTAVPEPSSISLFLISLCCATFGKPRRIGVLHNFWRART